jgi:hypothetical protein
VTFSLRYFRTGAPCAGASEGIVKPVSGCADAARELVRSGSPLVVELRIGVPTRAGTGDGALPGAARAAAGGIAVCVAAGGVAVAGCCR